MRATVVIPTLNARELLREALASLAAQSLAHEVVVVDNASTDGTAEMVAAEFPHVRLVRNEENLGFGRAVNRAALELEGEALVLVNNDVVCEPEFVARICEPLAADDVGAAAGVLLLASDPERIDSAGIELDGTLRSWDYLWNRPVSELEDAREPVGPCGGAAAYRLDAFKELGGFDERLFAYWEDVDLALRLRSRGLRCALAPGARALHRHGATLGAASPRQRRLEAFGRAYVLAKYRVARGRPVVRAQIALLDWPTLLVHLVVRREAGPIRERLRGLRAGFSGPPGPGSPLHLATVPFRVALARQLDLLRLRFTDRLPAHLHEHAPAAR